MNRALAAVSDETRLSILLRLRKGEMCACEIPALVGVSQPAVSQHLAVLLCTKLVNVRVAGRMRLYSLSAKGKRVIDDIENW